MKMFVMSMAKIPLCVIRLFERLEPNHVRQILNRYYHQSEPCSLLTRFIIMYIAHSMFIAM